jgi:hypothetical protein
MSILKLMRDRQMYKYGQRVNFQRGGTGGGTGDSGSPGTNNDGSNANSGGNDGGYRGPAEWGVTTRDVNRISMDPVDRSAVNQFSTYGKNVMNQNLQGPSTLSKIGTGIKDYVMGGGILGAGIRGLTGLYDKVTGPPDLGIRDGYNMANIAGPKSYDFGPGPGEGNDNQGIMAAYNPNMLNVSGEVVDEVPVSQEEEDFKQRFRVANEFRQDKQGQLDPAILEMISKLYS